jgi:hypothetical protein
MSIFWHDKVFWFGFEFNGSRVREARTTSNLGD